MRRKWLALLSLIPALAMVFTDQAVLPVALPTIQSHLGASVSELWWCVNSYLLTSAIFLLAGGKIGDRIGYRRTFLWGTILFALSSLLCGLSPTVMFLICARALQGVGAALMIPASAPLLMQLFPANERGKAIGINVSISSLFMILAPLIGGYFTEALSWRWIFYINLPIAALGLILTLLFIPPSPKGVQRFDPWGFCFFTIFGTSLIVFVMQKGAWDSPTIIALGLSCLIAALLLFWREVRAKDPFIDLSLFRHPIYKAVNISIFATQFVLMISIYRAIFFQEALGWTPFQSGTILSMTSLPVLFMSPVSGWLADRFTPKVPISIGFVLLIGSFFWLAFFIEGTLSAILIGLLAFGIGIPMIFTPSYSSAMGSVPVKKAGLAFGVVGTVRAFAASLGVAFVGAFVYWAQSRSFQSLMQSDPQHALHRSQMSAFFYTHLLIGCALIIAFALVLMLHHRKASHHLPEAPAEGWD